MFTKFGKYFVGASIALFGLVGVGALSTNANASAIHNRMPLAHRTRLVKATVPKLNNNFYIKQNGVRYYSPNNLAQNDDNSQEDNNSFNQSHVNFSGPLYKTVYGNDSSDVDNLDNNTILVAKHGNNSVNITSGWSSNNNHYIMASHPTWVHSGVIFTNKNHISTLKTGTPEVVKNTFNAFYQNGGRKNHLRFEIAPQFVKPMKSGRKNHSKFEIVPRFVEPMNVEHLYINYLSNLNKSSRRVQLRQSVIEYNDSNATKRVRRLAKGKILNVRRIIRIGKYDMTRLQLTNNKFITANKNYVAIL